MSAGHWLKKGAHVCLKRHWHNEQLSCLWYIQRSLPKWKRTWREAASRHTGMGGCKKGDEMALTVTTQENANKKKFDKSIAILLDFDFFKHPVYPEDLKN